MTTTYDTRNSYPTDKWFGRHEHPSNDHYYAIPINTSPYRQSPQFGLSAASAVSDGNMPDNFGISSQRPLIRSANGGPAFPSAANNYYPPLQQSPQSRLAPTMPSGIPTFGGRPYMTSGRPAVSTPIYASHAPPNSTPSPGVAATGRANGVPQISRPTNRPAMQSRIPKLSAINKDNADAKKSFQSPRAMDSRRTTEAVNQGNEKDSRAKRNSASSSNMKPMPASKISPEARNNNRQRMPIDSRTQPSKLARRPQDMTNRMARKSGPSNQREKTDNAGSMKPVRSDPRSNPGSDHRSGTRVHSDQNRRESNILSEDSPKNRGTVSKTDGPVKQRQMPDSNKLASHEQNKRYSQDSSNNVPNEPGKSDHSHRSDSDSRGTMNENQVDSRRTTDNEQNSTHDVSKRGSAISSRDKETDGGNQQVKRGEQTSQGRSRGSSDSSTNNRKNERSATNSERRKSDKRSSDLSRSQKSNEKYSNSSGNLSENERHSSNSDSHRKRSNSDSGFKGFKGHDTNGRYISDENKTMDEQNASHRQQSSEKQTGLSDKKSSELDNRYSETDKSNDFHDTDKLDGKHRQSDRSGAKSSRSRGHDSENQRSQSPDRANKHIYDRSHLADSNEKHTKSDSSGKQQATENSEGQSSKENNSSRMKKHQSRSDDSKRNSRSDRKEEQHANSDEAARQARSTKRDSAEMRRSNSASDVQQRMTKDSERRNSDENNSSRMEKHRSQTNDSERENKSDRREEQRASSDEAATQSRSASRENAEMRRTNSLDKGNRKERRDSKETGTQSSHGASLDRRNSNKHAEDYADYVKAKQSTGEYKSASDESSRESRDRKDRSRESAVSSERNTDKYNNDRSSKNGQSRQDSSSSDSTDRESHDSQSAVVDDFSRSARGGREKTRKRNLDRSIVNRDRHRSDKSNSNLTDVRSNKKLRDDSDKQRRRENSSSNWSRQRDNDSNKMSSSSDSKQQAESKNRSLKDNQQQSDKTRRDKQSRKDNNSIDSQSNSEERSDSSKNTDFTAENNVSSHKDKSLNKLVHDFSRKSHDSEMSSEDSKNLQQDRENNELSMNYQTENDDSSFDPSRSSNYNDGSKPYERTSSNAYEPPPSSGRRNSRFDEQNPSGMTKPLPADNRSDKPSDEEDDTQWPANNKHKHPIDRSRSVSPQERDPSESQLEQYEKVDPDEDVMLDISDTEHNPEYDLDDESSDETNKARPGSDPDESGDRSNRPALDEKRDDADDQYDRPDFMNSDSDPNSPPDSDDDETMSSPNVNQPSKNFPTRRASSRPDYESPTSVDANPRGKPPKNNVIPSGHDTIPRRKSSDDSHSTNRNSSQSPQQTGRSTPGGTVSDSKGRRSSGDVLPHSRSDVSKEDPIDSKTSSTPRKRSNASPHFDTSREDTSSKDEAYPVELSGLRGPYHEGSDPRRDGAEPDSGGKNNDDQDNQATPEMDKPNNNNATFSPNKKEPYAEKYPKAKEDPNAERDKDETSQSDTDKGPSRKTSNDNRAPKTDFEPREPLENDSHEDDLSEEDPLEGNKQSPSRDHPASGVDDPNSSRRDPYNSRKSDDFHSPSKQSQNVAPFQRVEKNGHPDNEQSQRTPLDSDEGPAVSFSDDEEDDPLDEKRRSPSRDDPISGMDDPNSSRRRPSYQRKSDAVKDPSRRNSKENVAPKTEFHPKGPHENYPNEDDPSEGDRHSRDDPLHEKRRSPSRDGSFSGVGDSNSSRQGTYNPRRSNDSHSPFRQSQDGMPSQRREKNGRPDNEQSQRTPSESDEGLAVSFTDDEEDDPSEDARHSPDDPLEKMRRSPSRDGSFGRVGDPNSSRRDPYNSRKSDADKGPSRRNSNENSAPKTDIHPREPPKYHPNEDNLSEGDRHSRDDPLEEKRRLPSREDPSRGPSRKSDDSRSPSRKFEDGVPSQKGETSDSSDHEQSQLTPLEPDEGPGVSFNDDVEDDPLEFAATEPYQPRDDDDDLDDELYSRDSNEREPAEKYHDPRENNDNEQILPANSYGMKERGRDESKPVDENDNPYLKNEDRDNSKKTTPSNERPINPLENKDLNAATGADKRARHDPSKDNDKSGQAHELDPTKERDDFHADNNKSDPSDSKKRLSNEPTADQASKGNLNDHENAEKHGSNQKGASERSEPDGLLSEPIDNDDININFKEEDDVPIDDNKLTEDDLFDDAQDDDPMEQFKLKLMDEPDDEQKKNNNGDKKIASDPSYDEESLLKRPERDFLNDDDVDDISPSDDEDSFHSVDGGDLASDPYDMPELPDLDDDIDDEIDANHPAESDNSSNEHEQTEEQPGEATSDPKGERSQSDPKREESQSDPNKHRSEDDQNKEKIDSSSVPNKFDFSNPRQQNDKAEDRKRNNAEINRPTTDNKQSSVISPDSTDEVSKGDETDSPMKDSHRNDADENVDDDSDKSTDAMPSFIHDGGKEYPPSESVKGHPRISKDDPFRRVSERREPKRILDDKSKFEPIIYEEDRIPEDVASETANEPNLDDDQVFSDDADDKVPSDKIDPEQKKTTTNHSGPPVSPESEESSDVLPLSRLSKDDDPRSDGTVGDAESGEPTLRFIDHTGDDLETEIDDAFDPSLGDDQTFADDPQSQLEGKYAVDPREAKKQNDGDVTNGDSSKYDKMRPSTDKSFQPEGSLEDDSLDPELNEQELDDDGDSSLFDREEDPWTKGGDEDEQFPLLSDSISDDYNDDINNHPTNLPESKDNKKAKDDPTDEASSNSPITEEDPKKLEIKFVDSEENDNVNDNPERSLNPDSDDDQELDDNSHLSPQNDGNDPSLKDPTEDEPASNLEAQNPAENKDEAEQRETNEGEDPWTNSGNDEIPLLSDSISDDYNDDDKRHPTYLSHSEDNKITRDDPTDEDRPSTEDDPEKLEIKFVDPEENDNVNANLGGSFEPDLDDDQELDDKSQLRPQNDGNDPSFKGTKRKPALNSPEAKNPDGNKYKTEPKKKDRGDISPTKTDKDPLKDHKLADSREVLDDLSKEFPGSMPSDLPEKDPLGEPAFDDPDLEDDQEFDDEGNLNEKTGPYDGRTENQPTKSSTLPHESAQISERCSSGPEEPENKTDNGIDLNFVDDLADPTKTEHASGKREPNNDDAYGRESSKFDNNLIDPERDNRNSPTENRPSDSFKSDDFDDPTTKDSDDPSLEDDQKFDDDVDEIPKDKTSNQADVFPGNNPSNTRDKTEEPLPTVYEGGNDPLGPDGRSSSKVINPDLVDDQEFEDDSLDPATTTPTIGELGTTHDEDPHASQPENNDDPGLVISFKDQDDDGEETGDSNKRRADGASETQNSKSYRDADDSQANLNQPQSDQPNNNKADLSNSGGNSIDNRGPNDEKKESETDSSKRPEDHKSNVSPVILDSEPRKDGSDSSSLQDQHKCPTCQMSHTPTGEKGSNDWSLALLQNTNNPVFTFNPIINNKIELPQAAQQIPIAMPSVTYGAPNYVGPTYNNHNNQYNNDRGAKEPGHTNKSRHHRRNRHKGTTQKDHPDRIEDDENDARDIHRKKGDPERSRSRSFSNSREMEDNYPSDTDSYDEDETRGKLNNTREKQSPRRGRSRNRKLPRGDDKMTKNKPDPDYDKSDYDSDSSDDDLDQDDDRAIDGSDKSKRSSQKTKSPRSRHSSRKRKENRRSPTRAKGSSGNNDPIDHHSSESNSLNDSQGQEKGNTGRKKLSSRRHSRDENNDSPKNRSGSSSSGDPTSGEGHKKPKKHRLPRDRSSQEVDEPESDNYLTETTDGKHAKNGKRRRQSKLGRPKSEDPSDEAGKGENAKKKDKSSRKSNRRRPKDRSVSPKESRKTSDSESRPEISFHDEDDSIEDQHLTDDAVTISPDLDNSNIKDDTDPKDRSDTPRKKPHQKKTLGPRISPKKRVHLKRRKKFMPERRYSEPDSRVNGDGKSKKSKAANSKPHRKPKPFSDSDAISNKWPGSRRKKNKKRRNRSRSNSPSREGTVVDVELPDEKSPQSHLVEPHSRPDKKRNRDQSYGSDDLDSATSSSEDGQPLNDRSSKRRRNNVLPEDEKRGNILMDKFIKPADNSQAASPYTEPYIPDKESWNPFSSPTKDISPGALAKNNDDSKVNDPELEESPNEKTLPNPLNKDPASVSDDAPPEDEFVDADMTISGEQSPRSGDEREIPKSSEQSYETPLTSDNVVSPREQMPERQQKQYPALIPPTGRSFGGHTEQNDPRKLKEDPAVDKVQTPEGVASDSDNVKKRSREPKSIEPTSSDDSDELPNSGDRPKRRKNNESVEDEKDGNELLDGFEKVDLPEHSDDKFDDVPETSIDEHLQKHEAANEIPSDSKTGRDHEEPQLPGQYPSDNVSESLSEIDDTLGEGQKQRNNNKSPEVEKEGIELSKNIPEHQSDGNNSKEPKMDGSDTSPLDSHGNSHSLTDYPSHPLPEKKRSRDDFEPSDKPNSGGDTIPKSVDDPTNILVEGERPKRKKGNATPEDEEEGIKLMNDLNDSESDNRVPGIDNPAVSATGPHLLANPSESDSRVTDDQFSDSSNRPSESPETTSETSSNSYNPARDNTSGRPEEGNVGSEPPEVSRNEKNPSIESTVDRSSSPQKENPSENEASNANNDVPTAVPTDESQKKSNELNRKRSRDQLEPIVADSESDSDIESDSDDKRRKKNLLPEDEKAGINLLERLKTPPNESENDSVEIGGESGNTDLISPESANAGREEELFLPHDGRAVDPSDTERSRDRFEPIDSSDQTPPDASDLEIPNENSSEWKEGERPKNGLPEDEKDAYDLRNARKEIRPEFIQNENQQSPVATGGDELGDNKNDEKPVSTDPLDTRETNAESSYLQPHNDDKKDLQPSDEKSEKSRPDKNRFSGDRFEPNHSEGEKLGPGRADESKNGGNNSLPGDGKGGSDLMDRLKNTEPISIDNIINPSSDGIEKYHDHSPKDANSGRQANESSGHGLEQNPASDHESNPVMPDNNLDRAMDNRPDTPSAKLSKSVTHLSGRDFVEPANDPSVDSDQERDPPKNHHDEPTETDELKPIDNIAAQRESPVESRQPSYPNDRSTSTDPHEEMYATDRSRENPKGSHEEPSETQMKDSTNEPGSIQPENYDNMHYDNPGSEDNRAIGDPTENGSLENEIVPEVKDNSKDPFDDDEYQRSDKTPSVVPDNHSHQTDLPEGAHLKDSEQNDNSKKDAEPSTETPPRSHDKSGDAIPISLPNRDDGVSFVPGSIDTMNGATDHSQFDREDGSHAEIKPSADKPDSGFRSDGLPGEHHKDNAANENLSEENNSDIIDQNTSKSENSLDGVPELHGEHDRDTPMNNDPNEIEQQKMDLNDHLQPDSESTINDIETEDHHEDPKIHDELHGQRLPDSDAASKLEGEVTKAAPDEVLEVPPEEEHETLPEIERGALPVEERENLSKEEPGVRPEKESDIPRERELEALPGNEHGQNLPIRDTESSGGPGEQKHAAHSNEQNVQRAVPENERLEDLGEDPAPEDGSVNESSLKPEHVDPIVEDSLGGKIGEHSMPLEEQTRDSNDSRQEADNPEAHESHNDLGKNPPDVSRNMDQSRIDPDSITETLDDSVDDNEAVSPERPLFEPEDDSRQPAPEDPASESEKREGQEESNAIDRTGDHEEPAHVRENSRTAALKGTENHGTSHRSPKSNESSEKDDDDESEFPHESTASSIPEEEHGQESPPQDSNHNDTSDGDHLSELDKPSHDAHGRKSEERNDFPVTQEPESNHSKADFGKDPHQAEEESDRTFQPDERVSPEEYSSDPDRDASLHKEQYNLPETNQAEMNPDEKKLLGKSTDLHDEPHDGPIVHREDSENLDLVKHDRASNLNHHHGEETVDVNSGNHIEPSYSNDDDDHQSLKEATSDQNKASLSHKPLNYIDPDMPYTEPAKSLDDLEHHHKSSLPVEEDLSPSAKANNLELEDHQSNNGSNEESHQQARLIPEDDDKFSANQPIDSNERSESPPIRNERENGETSIEHPIETLGRDSGNDEHSSFDEKSHQATPMKNSEEFLNTANEPHQQPGSKLEVEHQAHENDLHPVDHFKPAAIDQKESASNIEPSDAVVSPHLPNDRSSAPLEDKQDFGQGDMKERGAVKERTQPVENGNSPESSQDVPANSEEAYKSEQQQHPNRSEKELPDKHRADNNNLQHDEPSAPAMDSSEKNAPGSDNKPVFSTNPHGSPDTDTRNDGIDQHDDLKLKSRPEDDPNSDRLEDKSHGIPTVMDTVDELKPHQDQSSTHSDEEKEDKFADLDDDKPTVSGARSHYNDEAGALGRPQPPPRRQRREGASRIRSSQSPSSMTKESHKNSNKSPQVKSTDLKESRNHLNEDDDDLVTVIRDRGRAPYAISDYRQNENKKSPDNNDNSAGDNDKGEHSQPNSQDIKADLASRPLPPMSLEQNELDEMKQRKLGTGKTNTNRNRITKLNHKLTVGGDWNPKRVLTEKPDESNVQQKGTGGKAADGSTLTRARKLTKDEGLWDSLSASRRMPAVEYKQKRKIN